MEQVQEETIRQVEYFREQVFKFEYELIFDFLKRKLPDLLRNTLWVCRGFLHLLWILKKKRDFFQIHPKIMAVAAFILVMNIQLFDVLSEVRRKFHVQIDYMHELLPIENLLNMLTEDVGVPKSMVFSCVQQICFFLAQQ